MFSEIVVNHGAGKVLEALRTCLLSQDWILLGDIATNYQVFKSAGESGIENIIIAIDNTSPYVITFKAATGYNPVTKMLSNPTDERLIDWFNVYTKPCWFLVKKDYFTVVIKTKNELEPYAFSYCGLLNRYDPDDPYCIVCSGNTGPDEPPIGIAHGNTFTGAGFQLLQDHAGGYNRSMDATSLNANFGASQLPNPVDGKIILFPVIIGKQGSEIHGELNNVFSLQNADIDTEDIFTKGTDIYICFSIYNYKCAIKQT